MSNAFIQLAYRGKNQAWRYLLGSLLTLFTFQIIGSIASFGLLIAYVLSDGNPKTILLEPSEIGPDGLIVDGVSPLMLYVFFNLAFPFFLLGIYLALKWLHGRSLLSLITPAARINWKRIGQGFSVFFVLKVLEILISYWLVPADFTLTFQPSAFLAFLGVVILFTPLQTATEELFCRGYLLQGIGSKLGKWMAIILPSLLFTALHLFNPEVTTQANWQGAVSLLIYYFMIGAFLAWLTVKDKTLELALGAHAANNMATFLLVTSPNTVIPSPAIFSVAEIESDFTLLFFTALFLLTFSLIVFRVLKRPTLAD
ncbi:MAG: CPBP family intramembrane glutamic endopeptidase [Phormidesmis sp.]